MIIYYTEDFDGSRESSRRLLYEAIAAYAKDEKKAAALMAQLRESEGGKPYIEGFCPFSVSHTKVSWAVLFGERGCGLDIQFGKKCDILSIASRWFDPADYGIVKKASEESEAKALDAFYGIWTRREAFVKAYGGTVFDSTVPALCGGAAAKDGRNYYLSDILWPGANKLYAAVCTEGSPTDASDIVMKQLR